MCSLREMGEWVGVVITVFMCYKCVITVFMCNSCAMISEDLEKCVVGDSCLCLTEINVAGLSAL